MKKIKKMLALALGILMLASTMYACSKDEVPSNSDNLDNPGQSENVSSTDAVTPEKKLHFAYIARGLESQWPMDVADSYEKLAKERGFDITICDSQLSSENEMQYVDQMINMGVDAIFLLIWDEGSAAAIAERCADAGVLLIGESIPLADSDGQFVAPIVMLDAYNCGYGCSKWIAENYESLGFDFSDLSKVGFMAGADSRLQNDMNRVAGAQAGLLDAFPDFPKENIFLADVAADAASDALQASFNQASALIAANPQIEYWISVPVVEEDAVGICRALESANYADKSIICSVGGERAVLAWGDGQKAPWYACNYFHGMDAATLIVDAAYEVLTNNVPATEVFTPEEGQTYGYVTFSGTPCTFENYTDYMVVLD